MYEGAAPQVYSSFVQMDNGGDISKDEALGNELELVNMWDYLPSEGDSDEPGWEEISKPVVRKKKARAPPKEKKAKAPTPRTPKVKPPPRAPRVQRTPSQQAMVDMKKQQQLEEDIPIVFKPMDPEDMKNMTERQQIAYLMALSGDGNGDDRRDSSSSEESDSSGDDGDSRRRAAAARKMTAKGAPGGKGNKAGKAGKASVPGKAHHSSTPVEARLAGTSDPWQTFASQRDAARELNVDQSYVSKCIAGKVEQAGEYVFRRLGRQAARARSPAYGDDGGGGSSAGCTGTSLSEIIEGGMGGERGERGEGDRKAAMKGGPGGRSGNMSNDDSGSDDEAVDDIFQVERIVKRRIVKGKLQYHVKWENYGEQHNTWEPANSFLDDASIVDFETKRAAAAKAAADAGLLKTDRQYAMDIAGHDDDAFENHGDNGDSRESRREARAKGRKERDEEDEEDEEEEEDEDEDEDEDDDDEDEDGDDILGLKTLDAIESDSEDEVSEDVSDDFGPNLVGDKKDQTYLMSLPEVERENILMLRYQKRQKRLAGKADKSARDAAKKKTKKKTKKELKKEAKEARREARREAKKEAKKRKAKKKGSASKRKKSRAAENSSSDDGASDGGKHGRHDRGEEHAAPFREGMLYHGNREGADIGTEGADSWLEEEKVEAVARIPLQHPAPIRMQEQVIADSAAAAASISALSLEHVTGLQLTRDHLATLLHGASEQQKQQGGDSFSELIMNGFVRIGFASGHVREYRIAQVSGVMQLGSETYAVSVPGGAFETGPGKTIETNKHLKVVHGRTKSVIQVRYVSNSPFTASEMLAWKRVMCNEGLHAMPVEEFTMRAARLEQALRGEGTGGTGGAGGAGGSGMGAAAAALRVGLSGMASNQASNQAANAALHPAQIGGLGGAIGGASGSLSTGVVSIRLPSGGSVGGSTFGGGLGGVADLPPLAVAVWSEQPPPSSIYDSSTAMPPQHAPLSAVGGFAGGQSSVYGGGMGSGVQPGQSGGLVPHSYIAQGQSTAYGGYGGGAEQPTLTSTISTHGSDAGATNRGGKGEHSGHLWTDVPADFYINAFNAMSLPQSPISDDEPAPPAPIDMSVGVSGRGGMTGGYAQQHHGDSGHGDSGRHGDWQSSSAAASSYGHAASAVSASSSSLGSSRSSSSSSSASSFEHRYPPRPSAPPPNAPPPNGPPPQSFANKVRLKVWKAMMWCGGKE